MKLASLLLVAFGTSMAESVKVPVFFLEQHLEDNCSGEPPTGAIAAVMNVCYRNQPGKNFTMHTLVNAQDPSQGFTSQLYSDSACTTAAFPDQSPELSILELGCSGSTNTSFAIVDPTELVAAFNVKPASQSPCNLIVNGAELGDIWETLGEADLDMTWFRPGCLPNDQSTSFLITDTLSLFAGSTTCEGNPFEGPAKCLWTESEGTALVTLTGEEMLNDRILTEYEEPLDDGKIFVVVREQHSAPKCQGQPQLGGSVTPLDVCYREDPGQSFRKNVMVDAWRPSKGFKTFVYEDPDCTRLAPLDQDPEANPINLGCSSREDSSVFVSYTRMDPREIVAVSIVKPADNSPCGLILPGTELSDLWDALGRADLDVSWLKPGCLQIDENSSFQIDSGISFFPSSATCQGQPSLGPSKCVWLESEKVAYVVLTAEELLQDRIAGGDEDDEGKVPVFVRKEYHGENCVGQQDSSRIVDTMDVCYRNNPGQLFKKNTLVNAQDPSQGFITKEYSDSKCTTLVSTAEVTRRDLGCSSRQDSSSYVYFTRMNPKELVAVFGVKPAETSPCDLIRPGTELSDLWDTFGQADLDVTWIKPGCRKDDKNTSFQIDSGISFFSSSATCQGQPSLGPSKCLWLDSISSKTALVVLTGEELLQDQLAISSPDSSAPTPSDPNAESPSCASHTILTVSTIAIILLSIL